jgi:hypothetical protein
MSNGSAADNYCVCDNCEIHGFGHTGVYMVGGSNCSVHHCYIHHCRGMYPGNLLGYGVTIAGTEGVAVWPVVEGNVFNYNRHSTATVAYYASYPGYHKCADFEIRFNWFGPDHPHGGIMDVHGTNTVPEPDEYTWAGSQWKMHHNTCVSIGQNPMICVRGIPRIGGQIYRNWTYDTPDRVYVYSGVWGYYRTISQIMVYISGYGYNAPYGNMSTSTGEHPWQKIAVTDNWYGTTAPSSGGGSGSGGGTAEGTIQATDRGSGYNHVTELTIDITDALTLADNVAKGVGYKLFVFPAGALVIDAAYMSMAITAASAQLKTDTPDVGLGTGQATGTISLLSADATYEDIITGQTAANCNGTPTAKPAVPTAGKSLIVAAGDSHNLYFNIADTWADDSSGDLTADIVGKVVIAWRFLSE